MIEQIFKSKNITVTRDLDPNNNDPHTSIFIDEHTSDKKVILDELIDEVQKPYSYKLTWSMGLIMSLNIAVTIGAIHYGVIDWVNILNWVIFAGCIYAGNKFQKAEYTSRTLVLLFTILKVDGQI